MEEESCGPEVGAGNADWREFRFSSGIGKWGRMTLDFRSQFYLHWKGLFFSTLALEGLN